MTTLSLGPKAPYIQHDPPDWKNVKVSMESMLEKAGFPDVRVDFERGQVDFGRHVKPLDNHLRSPHALVTGIPPGDGFADGSLGIILDIIEVKTGELKATVVLTSQVAASTVCPDIGDEAFCGDPEDHPERNAHPLDLLVPSMLQIEATINDRKQCIAYRMRQAADKTGTAAQRQRRIGWIHPSIEQDIATIETLLTYPRRQMGVIFYASGRDRLISAMGRLSVAAIELKGDVAENASNNVSTQRIASF